MGDQQTTGIVGEAVAVGFTSTQVTGDRGEPGSGNRATEHTHKLLR
ncbi:MAG: hypothetical protein HC838_06770 [Spirulinaceae cyanobacterium RM2_2_10]|nr:hypothetical protein [Spirulinaceae cyanobacterium RM2_2_10]